MAVVGVFLSVVVGIGLSLLGNFLAGKGGQKLAEKGIEELIERGIEKSGGGEAEVDIEEGRVAVRDQETGQQFAVNTASQLPSGFPADLPVFSPSEVKGSVVMGPMTMVSFETTAPLASVGAYYNSNLPAQGWIATYVAPMGDQSFSGVFKKETRQMTVAVTPTGETGKVSFVLSYGPLEQPTEPAQEP